jgi:hypothetical protein
LRAAQLLPALCCWLLALGVKAQQPPPLGTAGQWLLGGGLGVAFEASDETEPEAALSVAPRDYFSHWLQPLARAYPDAAIPRSERVEHWSAWLQPNVRLFVITNVSLGAQVDVTFDHYARDAAFEHTAVGFGGSLALGHLLRLSPDLFMLPELALGALLVRRTYESSSPSPLGSFGSLATLSRNFEGDPNRLQALLTLPVCWSATPGFFVGLGPYLRVQYAFGGDLTSSGQTWALSVGLSSLLGAAL